MSELGRILIVDDESEVRDVLSEFFSSQGYAITTAGSGAEALASVHRERPDLVLLDMRMPGMDGVEVLKRVREHDATIGVIMITANEDVELARRTLELGAFDYVAKPFDFSYLERAVVTAVAGAGGGALSPPADGLGDAFHALAVAVFRAVRSMSGAARVSTGERLETSALAAARHAAAGERGEALRMLNDLRLLLRLAAALGDVQPAARLTIEGALEVARKVAGAGA